MPPDEIVFPCFEGEVIYWEAMEIDDVSSDKSQTVMNCDYLQRGYNKFYIEIQEDGSLMQSTAQALENLGGWSFDFFSSEDDESQKTATYSMLLHVSDECYWEAGKNLDEIDPELGTFTLVANPDDEIIAKI